MPRADRAAVVALVLLPFVLLSPALLPGRVLSPLDQLFAVSPWRAIAPGPVEANPALADVAQVFHPWTLYAAREVRAGRFPFWNPYAYAGVPFFSNPQTALLSPLTVLTWVLPSTLALTLPSLVKLVAAGLAMYWFLRVLALAPAAAFIGAAGFMLSSTMIGWLSWTYTATVPFLPLIFGLIERLAQRPTRRGVALLALAVGLDALAGYPQATFHTLLAAAAWTLARAPWRAGAAGFLARVAVGVALGAALAAAQALPALDYVRESAVMAYRGQWTAPLAVPGRASVTALMPVFFGTGARTWSVWQFAITSTYVGLVPLLGLPLAALTRRSPTLFFTALVVVVAGVHYGVPVIGDAIAHAPGMALGTNTRLMPLLVFGVCALGALGLDVAARGAWPAGARPVFWVRAWTVALLAAGLAAVVLASGDPRAEAVWPSLAVQYALFAVGLTAGSLLLLRWLVDGRARWGLALAIVQTLTLAPLAASYQPVRDTRWLYPSPPAIAWLQQHAGAGRVLMADHVGLLYGLRQANGYDGLSPRRIEQLAGPIGSGNPRLQGFLENTLALHGSEPLSPLAVLLSPARDLLGVRLIVLPPGSASPAAGWTIAYDGADARIFANPGALPRAFVATRARCVADAEALRLLRARAVDVAREVLLADCAAPPGGATAATRVEARIAAESTDRVLVDAATDAPAWLVLTDTWFPGWGARVDGVQTPIWRADHAFRAVALPPGRHEIEFTFRPRRLLAGIAISAVAALVVAVLLLLPRRTAAPAVALAVLAIAGGAEAALPAPPFELSVTPTAAAAGESVTVNVAPRGVGATGAVWDVYVLWLYSEPAAFLTPEGTWSPRPVPWRARLGGREYASAPWRRVGPPADITLALVVVEPAADPLERFTWRFRPDLATLRVRGPTTPPAWARVVAPGLVALVAVALVILVPLPRSRPL
jgi:hypothetical protein